MAYKRLLVQKHLLGKATMYTSSSNVAESSSSLNDSAPINPVSIRTVNATNRFGNIYINIIPIDSRLV
jgi:hypothetical protein